MPVKPLFSEQDLEAVRQAVAAAEGQTSGEIVPFVVDASDAYEGTLWKGTALGALGTALLAAMVHAAAGLWGGGVLWIALPAAGGGALGFLITAFVPAVKRALIPADVLERRVRRRAAVAFVEEEVFSTEDRTGILLLLSLFEHRVVVLGDAGINAKVGEEEWLAITDAIAAGIRQGRPGEALVEGIAACGRLLSRRGVEIQPDDRNELRDDLRRRDR
jgi:putative membrane protein